MSIHAEFWKSRPFFIRVRRARDSNRQRCYNWEFKHLRPNQRSFTDRQAAKGFARLCAKVAVKRLLEIHPSADRDVILASFKAAFTRENIRRCDGAEGGVYFANWGWTDVIIAHEVAHWADRWDAHLSQRQSYEGHGPKWRGWFIFILSDVRDTMSDKMTSLHMKTTLKESRLAYQMPGEI